MKVIIRWERAALGDLVFLSLCETPAAIKDFRMFTALVAILERLVEGGVANQPADELGSILDQVRIGLLSYRLWQEPGRATIAWGEESIPLIARPPKYLN
jgi:hypothetical protein